MKSHGWRGPRLGTESTSKHGTRGCELVGITTSRRASKGRAPRMRMVGAAGGQTAARGSVRGQARQGRQARAHVFSPTGRRAMPCTCPHYKPRLVHAPSTVHIIEVFRSRRHRSHCLGSGCCVSSAFAMCDRAKTLRAAAKRCDKNSARSVDLCAVDVLSYFRLYRVITDAHAGGRWWWTCVVSSIARQSRLRTPHTWRAAMHQLRMHHLRQLPREREQQIPPHLAPPKANVPARLPEFMPIPAS